MNREKYLKNIIENLTILKTKVELLNAVSYYDINITSEYFYCNFLNLIYDYNLKNANAITKNIKAIDLIDEEGKMAIQVTSENTSTKIKKTIQKFEEAKQYQKYNKLKILILTTKKSYTAKFSSKHFTFDTKNDIIDTTDICNFLKDKEVDFLEKVSNYLEKEIRNKITNDENISEANEIDTIIKLIEYISNSKCKKIERKEVVVDPEYKLNNRFSDYADYLKERYFNLYLVYNESLKVVNETLGIDEAQILISDYFLQDISVQYLNEENNDPVKALQNLVSYFEKKISNHGKKYDLKAIEFFLVDQIIKCNIFPNIKGVYI